MSDSAIGSFHSQMFEHFISLLYFYFLTVTYDRQYKGRTWTQEIERWNEGGNMNHLIMLTLYILDTPPNGSAYGMVLKVSANATR